MRRGNNIPGGAKAIGGFLWPSAWRAGKPLLHNGNLSMTDSMQSGSYLVTYYLAAGVCKQLYWRTKYY